MDRFIDFVKVLIAITILVSTMAIVPFMCWRGYLELIHDFEFFVRVASVVWFLGAVYFTLVLIVGWLKRD